MTDLPIMSIFVCTWTKSPAPPTHPTINRTPGLACQLYLSRFQTVQTHYRCLRFIGLYFFFLLFLNFYPLPSGLRHYTLGLSRFSQTRYMRNIVRGDLLTFTVKDKVIRFCYSRSWWANVEQISWSFKLIEAKFHTFLIIKAQNHSGMAFYIRWTKV